MNLYVHVPFCVSKCRYCGFHSQTGASASAFAAFPGLVARELALRAPSRAPSRPPVGGALRTLYVGGGTPSILGADGLRALAAALPARTAETEFTVEANPADVTAALADALGAVGVTRVSLGAQAFDADALRFLGRRHTPGDTVAAVSALRHAGIDNLSLDLIAAIPGVAGADFRRSVEQAVALEPRHVSVYALTVEDGTRLAADVAAGRVQMPSDDAALDALAVAEGVLARAGYRRYEISNYALPGFECRHNLAVWQGEDYVGLGPAASSRQGLTRRTNRPDLAAWAAAIEAGQAPPADVETLSPEADEHERFVTRFRLASGHCPDPATARGRARLAVCERLERLGVLARLATGAYALTPRGREVADAVMAEFD
ncbi:MAG: radical SAM family heme chaperone HemW [Kiritimatiellia bacterium]|jgi:oxygen-independent coproporphyrinogen-3 oxidase